MISNPFAAVRGVWRFKGNLDDEISGNDFESDSGVVDFGNISIFDFFLNKLTSRQGLKFSDGVSLSAGSDFDFTYSGSYQLLIMFWWYSPGLVGQTKHAITRKITPKIAPIIAKANSSITDGIETITAGEWVISEIGASSTTNAIQLSICGSGGNPTHTVISDEYTPGLHHIGIVMQLSSPTNDYYAITIDGKPGTYFNGPTTITPAAPSSIRINQIGHGYTAHKTTQTDAIIGDLSVIAYGINTASWPLRMMRFGVEYVTENSLVSSVPTFNAIAYSQPSTTSTNQILNYGESIILGRSNGDIVVGQRGIWDNDIDFSGQSSVGKLNTSEIDDCPIDGDFENKKTVCWTENGVRIQGATIRI